MSDPASTPQAPRISLITAEMYHALTVAHAEVARLRDAVRRLADQDATLSVQGGNVTVTMDATLTAEEREAVKWFCGLSSNRPHMAEKTLRGLLDRLA